MNSPTITMDKAAAIQKLDEYQEAARWHPEPPRDPYLLKPLAGSLMEIVAEWDLTPLEIAAVKNART